MLDALRRGSTGMVAKALFAILVISFAIWGIGPVFRNFGRGALAKVGSHEIRVEDFQRSLQNELRAISRQTGRHITPEQARAAGINQRVRKVLEITRMEQVFLIFPTLDDALEAFTNAGTA